MSHAFSACRHLSHHYSSYFSTFFTYAYMGPAYFVKYCPLLAFMLRQAAPLGFDRLLIAGDKKIKC